jgi:transcriptional regulator with XRE-family HTH domain
VAIGDRIRAARKAAGLSQEEVARRAGLSLKGMGDIERGDIEDPHFSSLTKIAHALDVPVEVLIREEEPVPLAEASETGPSDQGASEEQWPKTVAEVRAKFLPIAAMLEDYCRAYEQLTERAELTDEDVEAFVHTAVEANDYHLQAIEGELVELGYVLGRKLTQKEQLYDLSVLRPAFARYRALMRALVERLPAGAEKNTLAELARGV